MPKIELRTALASDIPYLVAFDHVAVSHTVWRMTWAEEGAFGATFVPVPLPRPLKLPYPRDPQRLMDDWQRRGLLLVALHDGRPLGYLAAAVGGPIEGLWITDLVVDTPWRRQGIASALVLTASEWARERGERRMVLETSFRNSPAVGLARRLGFVFSGFQYGYYPNGDAALFFSLPLA